MTTNTYRIAVIGPKDMIAGFRALGVDIFPADSGSEALTVIKQPRAQSAEGEKSHAVILVTSTILEDIPQAEYAKLGQSALPAITAISDITGSDRAGADKLKRLTERAIGSDILS